MNATDGIKIWNYTTGENYLKVDRRVDSSPTVVQGVVDIGAWDNNVYALNATTGVKLWDYNTGSYVEMTSPAVVDDVIYIGSGRTVYALDASTGLKLWNYTTGGAVYSSPAVLDGVVYVGSTDHNVYAFVVSGLLPSPNPTASPTIPEMTTLIVMATMIVTTCTIAIVTIVIKRKHSMHT